MEAQIKIQLLEGGTMPTKAHASDACYDVVARARRIENGYIEYDLGFCTEMPERWVGHIFARSSISSSTDLVLCNSVAVIDAGYRKEWKARFAVVNRAFTYESRGQEVIHSAYPSTPLLYEVGDRVAQILFVPLPFYSLDQVDSLGESERKGGLGHTTNEIGHV